MFDLPVHRQIEIARTIFPDLEDLGNGICQATCPGISCHSTKNSPRDFRLWFEEGKGPHDHCVHASCAAARDAAMAHLYAALRREDPTVRTRREEHAAARSQYAAAPTLRRAPFELYSPTLAKQVADGCPLHITEDWLRAHSPIPIPADPTAWPRLLLDSIYPEGAKIIIFTKFASQGQILHTVGGSTVRLEDSPPAYGHTYPARRPCGFPRGAQNGVWFLAAPVTGEWQPNENNRDRHGAKLGRRHAACATSFPFLVLESDEAPPAVWLRILAQLHDPIVAIYTSGGKSYHALIRVSCRTKEEFDLRRTEYCTRLTALGADPAAITAVRLTRLPGCLRFGTGDGPMHRPYLDADGKPAPRMQQLLYLNPDAHAIPLISLFK
jgi:hypothetical protein